MAVDIRDFHNAARQLTEKHRQVDLDDLHHEMADRETGRNSRFRNKERSGSEAEQRRKAATQAHMTALDVMLLNDPEYAKLYNDTMDLLARAERAAEQALEHAERALQQARDEMQEVLDNASQLRDGRKVFKDANGHVWTEDDELVSPDEAESIVWKEDSPTREHFTHARQQQKDKQDHVDQIRHYQVDVLGKSRERLEDKENPMTKDEIKQFQETLLDKSPKDIAERVDADITEAPQPKTASHEIDVLKF